VSVGLPGFVNNVVIDAVENIGKVLAAAGKLFADDPKQSPADHTNQVLFGPAGPPPAPAPPPTPNGDSGLNSGATSAGETYNDGVEAAQLTDQKLADLLKQIFASNQAARDKVSAILTEIGTKQKQIAAEMGDPASVSAFGQFLDQKFAEIQKVLTDAQVDAKTQAAIIDALGDEYRGNGPNPPNADDTHPPESGATGGPATSTDSAETSSTAPAGDSAAGQDPLIDPLAGMGIGAPTGMDPLSAMGPALAGLSALPGAMGGGLAGGASPLDALGSLGQLGALAGHGFTDSPPSDTDTKAKDGFTDKPADKTTDAKPPASDPADALKDDQHHESGQPATSPAGNSDSTAPQPPTPHDAAPASAPVAAPGDPARTVTLPDGRVVTAPDDKIAVAMRSVLSGTSVPDAFNSVGLSLPPPGTPVIDPADPARLDPGSLAQFQSRPPVMAMGDGKIWLDGQLQPIGALGSSSDFLGWSKPPTKASPQTAAAAPPSAS
jgi:hypothetical protein